MGASRSSEPRTRMPLERLQPALFHALRNGFFVDQLYAVTILRLAWWMAALHRNWLDRWVWSGIPMAASGPLPGAWGGSIFRSTAGW